ncbi:hypothetical protein, partial [Klebsiella pneumoniae]|uniref:hypothetical protein n=1 Tax=Klebsiella pneumoniae TaxID=573 RepID=UPI00371497A9
MPDVLHAAASSLALIGAFDSDLFGIVGLSLGVSLSASLIAMVIGAPLGGLLAVGRFGGRHTLIILVNA